MDEAREPVVFVLVAHSVLGSYVLRVERYVLFQFLHITGSRVQRSRQGLGAPLHASPNIFRRLALHF